MSRPTFILAVIIGVFTISAFAQSPLSRTDASDEDETPELELSDDEYRLIEDYAIVLTQRHVERLTEDMEKLRSRNPARPRIQKQIEIVQAYGKALADRIRLQREIAELQSAFAEEAPADSAAAIKRLEALDRACDEARKAVRQAKKEYAEIIPLPMPNYLAMSKKEATKSKLRRLENP